MSSDLHEHTCECNSCDVHNNNYDIIDLIFAGDSARLAAKWTEYSLWIHQDYMTCDIDDSNPEGEETVIENPPRILITEEIFKGVYESETMKAVSKEDDGSVGELAD